MYKFKNPYMTEIARVSFLQRVIIIHSLLYYEHNKTIWLDVMYDEIAHQLVDAMEWMTEEDLQKTQYYYAMYDFDGTTGYDISYRLYERDKKYLTNIALQCYNWYKKGNKDE